MAKHMAKHIAQESGKKKGQNYLHGAAILAFIDALRDGIDWSFVPAYLVGTAVALVAGVLSIHLMRYIGKKRRFGGFAYYCWVIGVLSIILYLIF